MLLQLNHSFEFKFKLKLSTSNKLDATVQVISIYLANGLNCELTIEKRIVTILNGTN